MTISLYDRNPLAVSCSANSQELALLIVDDQQQQQSHLQHDREVFVELDDANAPPEPDTIVKVYSNATHDAYVWEQTSSGWDAWARDSSGTCYRTITAPADAELHVAVVANGSSPPAAPPAPGSSNGTLLDIKVRKKGDLPLLSPAGPHHPAS